MPNFALLSENCCLPGEWSASDSQYCLAASRGSSKPGLSSSHEGACLRALRDGEQQEPLNPSLSFHTEPPHVSGWESMTEWVNEWMSDWNVPDSAMKSILAAALTLEIWDCCWMLDRQGVNWAFRQILFLRSRRERKKKNRFVNSPPDVTTQRQMQRH